MSRPDEYRKRAAELMAESNLAHNPTLARELNELATVYHRLAEQAERNLTADLVYEPPPVKLND
jgi:hypothetical protein